MFDYLTKCRGMTAARAKLRVTACFELGQVIEGESRFNAAVRMGIEAHEACTPPAGVCGQLLRFPARAVKAAKPGRSQRKAAADRAETAAKLRDLSTALASDTPPEDEDTPRGRLIAKLRQRLGRDKPQPPRAEGSN